jgi:hypothetical protein
LRILLLSITKEFNVMAKRYIIIQKENEKIISRHIFYDLINVKANVDLMQYWNPKHKFEIFEIGQLIEL